MGCNYYTIKKCECCGHEERKHIGKSSAGWVFALHIEPENGINSLEDWKKYWKDKTIINEYGEEITPDEMLDNITNRSHPNGLSRLSHCVRHGDGTYDYCEEE